MKLVLYNGSPRRNKSNSRRLLEKFRTGYEQLVDGAEIETAYLADTKNTAAHVQLFETAENVVIVFPLYTDAMPGIVKLFFEALLIAKTARPKTIGFIVHSGFPEAVHSTFVERYLEKLVRRLKYTYAGTLIKGGSEGVRLMPPAMNRKLFKNLKQLGQDFAATGNFNPKIVARMRRPMRLSVFRRGMFRIMAFFGMTNMYWNMNLKRNNAYDKRFAQPYLPE